jgi:hypothetical protein
MRGDGRAPDDGDHWFDAELRRDRRFEWTITVREALIALLVLAVLTARILLG